jgi:hypothetical protein
VAATPIQYCTDLVKPIAKPSHPPVLAKRSRRDDGDYEDEGENEGEGDDTDDDDATSPPASPRLEALAYTADDDSWSDFQEGQGEPELLPLTDESKLSHIMRSLLIILVGITVLDTESQSQEPSQPAKQVAKKRQLSTSEEVSLLNFSTIL